VATKVSHGRRTGLKNCNGPADDTPQLWQRSESIPVNVLDLREKGVGNSRADRPRMNQPQKRFVYVLRSLKDPTRQCVGRTYDVASRLASHNAGASPKTTKHRPWQVVVLVQFLSEERAEEFQKFLKSASGRAFTKQYFA
jgi:putative endonuclease